MSQLKYLTGTLQSLEPCKSGTLQFLEHHNSSEPCSLWNPASLELYSFWSITTQVLDWNPAVQQLLEHCIWET